MRHQAVLACLSMVALASLSSAGEGRRAAMQEEATTFVWPAAQPQATPAAASGAIGKARPARIAAARGRMVARGQRLAATREESQNPEPLGFDIGKTLGSAVKRGEQGSSSLIHIDLPIRQYQVGETVRGDKPSMVPRNVDGTELPAYLRLNKVEAATLKEEQKDPGGVSRLKAMGTHFAHRVDKLLVSIGRKLKLADEWRKEHRVPNALSQLQALRVPKSDEATWAKQIQDLDDVIAAHGGDPPPLDSSMQKARKAQTRQEQIMYQDALRRAFGKNPTLPVP